MEKTFEEYWDERGCAKCMSSSQWQRAIINCHERGCEKCLSPQRQHAIIGCLCRLDENMKGLNHSLIGPFHWATTTCILVFAMYCCEIRRMDVSIITASEQQIQVLWKALKELGWSPDPHHDHQIWIGNAGRGAHLTADLVIFDDYQNMRFTETELNVIAPLVFMGCAVLRVVIIYTETEWTKVLVHCICKPPRIVRGISNRIGFDLDELFSDKSANAPKLSGPLFIPLVNYTSKPRLVYGISTPIDLHLDVFSYKSANTPKLSSPPFF